MQSPALALIAFLLATSTAFASNDPRLDLLGTLLLWVLVVVVGVGLVLARIGFRAVVNRLSGKVEVADGVTTMMVNGRIVPMINSGDFWFGYRDGLQGINRVADADRQGIAIQGPKGGLPFDREDYLRGNAAGAKAAKGKQTHRLDRGG